MGEPACLVLGIESSCDDTGIAVVKDGCEALSNRIASSAGLQARYGGVVPEVAAREHVATILPTLDASLKDAGAKLSDLGGIAVTVGPGLLGALMVGISMAKALAIATGLPLVGVHHLEAHLYANALVAPVEFPALALVVSGGHTSLWRWEGHGRLVRLGETLDDAAGEAFDKGARLLGLPYPGGPAIQRLAAQGDDRFRLPVAQLGAEHPYDFSFSGVKTAMRALLEAHPEEPAAVAHALQTAIVAAVVRGTMRALRDQGVPRLYLAGGVSANQALREALARETEPLGVRLHIPPLQYCTDNGAMVGAAGYWALQAGRTLALDIGPRTPFPLGA